MPYMECLGIGPTKESTSFWMHQEIRNQLSLAQTIHGTGRVTYNVHPNDPSYNYSSPMDGLGMLDGVCISI